MRNLFVKIHTKFNNFVFFCTLSDATQSSVEEKSMFVQRNAMLMVHFGKHAQFTWCVRSMMATLIVGIDPVVRCRMLQKRQRHTEKNNTIRRFLIRVFGQHKNRIAIQ